MATLLIAVGAFVGYLVAYHTYGRWLARRIFGLDPSAPVPSRQLRDDVDFVPTRKEVIFGHHFTSIAGTGPIVGPAIAVFWGWLPALLWVLLGSIFIGAVHDFGALVVSLRNRGQTVGEIAGRMITPRAKVLFLSVLFLALSIVLAIFGLVIAAIFSLYPESVLSVWIEIPIAIAIGFYVYRRGGHLLVPSLLALGLLYLAIYVGAYYLPITLPASWGSAPVVWTFILLGYCFVASVLPVWTLLQPRDYINSHQLVVALGLLVLGLIVAGATGQANLVESAPRVADADALKTLGAPPIWPFLFITIACGAVSGFHCLVSSGTSSKQVASEQDAQYVGYGAMLLEGGLAVVVILACCAGVGMGAFERTAAADGTAAYVAKTSEAGVPLTGRAAWNTLYDPNIGWNNFGLGPKVGAFVEGGANFLTALGIPLKLAVTIVAVLVASFAATTLDTATRLQRYVVQELAGTVRLTPLTNKYVATALAVGLAGSIAMLPGGKGPASGGFLLWPLFGATNQLLAGLAFMVIVFYLWRRNKPVWFAAVPMVLMVVLPAWAILWLMFNFDSGWFFGSFFLTPENTISWRPLAWLDIDLVISWGRDLHLFGFGLAILALQGWMVVEALLTWRRARGVLEESLPPLPLEPALATAGGDGGRSC
ncbi:MAG: carbon starvation protein A [Planctomycetota bacterium]|nr:MAG: carbon starvation protein A [Planctomycetota bacterium]REK26981.1 MAG: carbon starvation protein A [Planctomycetota bacterium]REK47292.1 MAG: carbon starvation protein A [Planctomycetota bacterium]